ncbi:MAG: hypothetical protein HQL69_09730 [Magnetococcales bacterium]|nr:hypothetical protein [Magnetococcales bacterium]
MAKICPSCAYERKENDLVADYECPQCGIIYAKYSGNNKKPDKSPKPIKAKKSKINWGFWRIGFLLIILLIVGEMAISNESRISKWFAPAVVAVHIIAADDSPNTAQFIDSINIDSFLGLEWFFTRNAQLHEFALENPIKLHIIDKKLYTHPPIPPKQPNIFTAIFWSLHMRFWASGIEYSKELNPDIQLFLLYHDPEITNRVPHSFGLKKGRIGVANLFASHDMSASNKVIIVHELLHTLGATDKYNPANNMPSYPDGYAEPNKNPLYPQVRGEIMGGRIPISSTEATIPFGLSQMDIGSATAKEIYWINGQ